MVLREFYASEAEESLAAMRAAAWTDAPDREELLKWARLLRGSSLLASDDRVHDVASALVAGLTDASVTSRPDFRERLTATLEDLEILVVSGGGGLPLDERARIARDRWGGVPRPAVNRDGEGAAMAFVAREAAAIADTMDDAVSEFQSDPTNRDWLATVLKRQRVLLGSVHVEDMPIVGESLRAVEDLTGLVISLDAPVKAEWLDVFRAGRDVLRAAHEALSQGEAPAPIPALSRLRTLHEELMSRYGEHDAGGDAGEEAAILVEGDGDTGATEA